jgi:hypothetical protein
VQHNVLSTHPVEFLVVDGIGIHVWKPWLQHGGQEHQPKVIIIFSDGKDLSTEQNVINKQFRKEIE